MKHPPAKPKTKVLIIDDSPEVLEAIKAVLEMEGFEVITRDSPRDITSFVKMNRIDILILDIILQNINGKIVCKELKSDPLTSYFPIIIMSATPAYLQDYREHSADDAIEKPFDIPLLVKKIKALTT